MTAVHACPALLAALLAAQTAMAQTTPAPAVAILLEQARFWSAHHNPDQARTSLQRVLRLDPGNVDALAALEKIRPRDPRLPESVTTARLADAEALLTTGDAASAERLLSGVSEPLTPPQRASLKRLRAGLVVLREARALREAPRGPAGSDVRTTLPLLGPEDLQAPAQAVPAPPAPSLASPPELSDQGDYVRQTDEDGDQVFVRRRMLDTNVTDLPPPIRNGAGASPSAVVVDTRPPVPVITATAISSREGGPAGIVAEPATDTGTRVNPYADIPPPTDPGLMPLADLGAPATPADPMTARIDHDIAAFIDGFSVPGVQAAAGFRGRSGTAGTSQLGEITAPLQASFSVGGRGLIGLVVTPDFLSAGTLSRNAASLSQFGTLALGQHANTAIASQTADGVGLDVSYRTSAFSADIGATPLGFQQQSVVGGLEWVPTLDEGVRLRLTGERRAVTDSLLSYAGTTDPQSGTKWGGVTYDRGHVNLEFTGALSNAYLGVGGGLLDGENVKSNTEIEAGAGGSTRIWAVPGQELRLGIDLVYYRFATNLGGFTLGQGGYFSPQTYFAALFPLTIKGQPTRNLSYEIGGTAGVQTYHENSSAAFPDNAILQSALEAQQANPATAIGGVATTFPGQNVTGFSGGAHGLIDYSITPGFHVGGRLDYEHTGDFNQFVGLLYGRYVFGGPAGR